ncbi:MAG TPA: hypothetical protein EYP55_06500 [Anaerolineae bacterium]|nr:hypothetical protein [Anaerolineae bacterium]
MLFDPQKRLHRAQEAPGDGGGGVQDGGLRPATALPGRGASGALRLGTPQEVADEVKRRIDDLAPGGGFVFAAVHNIQAMVPLENVVAAFETALEYGRY